MADNSRKEIEDGGAFCALPASRQGTGESEAVAQTKNSALPLWHKIRSGSMLGVGCALSPCCTPLIVPLGLALLAGSPFAAWASLNLGLIYGALTVLSIANFVLAWRWFQPNKSVPPTLQPSANLSLKKAVAPNPSGQRGTKNANR